MHGQPLLAPLREEPREDPEGHGRRARVPARRAPRGREPPVLGKSPLEIYKDIIESNQNAAFELAEAERLAEEARHAHDAFLADQDGDVDLSEDDLHALARQTKSAMDGLEADQHGEADKAARERELKRKLRAATKGGAAAKRIALAAGVSLYREGSWWSENDKYRANLDARLFASDAKVYVSHDTADALDDVALSRARAKKIADLHPSREQLLVALEAKALGDVTAEILRSHSIAKPRSDDLL